ncbi:Ig-like domain-containing protein [Terrabacter sp. 2RAF25]|uniref:Ig-like domain-containing protein n=1 Tax=Terrabacter sp. 2RAF25 TaxID=3232998 RepID=UPI003F9B1824
MSRKHHIRFLTAVTGSVVMAAGLGSAWPAFAAGINEPPVAPHSIIVFPERDFISAAGYQQGQTATVNVVRAGFVVGTALVDPQDDPTTVGFDGIVEVNHPGGGCWAGVTPDIRPGDVVQVLTAPDTGDQTTTADVTITQKATLNPADPTSVIVKGTATSATGGQIPVDQLEARIVAAKQSFLINGKRTIRASSTGGEGTLAYDGPTVNTWTATFTGLGQFDPVAGLTDAQRAVANETRGMWLGRIPAAAVPLESTIFEFGQVGGPGAPCTAPADRGPSTPDLAAASDSGSSSTDNVTSNPMPTFGGVRGLPTATTINLYIDGAPAGSTTTIAPNGAWSITPTVPLADGPHTVTAGEVSGASPETMGLGALPFTIDTVAPATSITSGPAVAGTARTVIWRFTSDAGSTFTCSLTPGAAAQACLTGMTYGPLTDGRYTFTVGATDLAGNVGATRSAAFAVGVAPTVSTRSPLPGQSRIVQTANVTATFSSAVTGVSGTSFVLRSPSGAVVPAVVSYNAPTHVATLNPNATLAPDTRYAASLTTAVKSADFGVAMVSTTWTFLTGPAPVVNFRSPASGAVGVSRVSNVTVGFTEPVAGVSTASVVLRSPSGAIVPAVVTYNATTRRATLNPNATLAARTRYTLGLTSGIRDTAGNILTPSTAAFTTGG